MKKGFCCIFVLMMVIILDTGVIYGQPNLLFKSGFESGVEITGKGVSRKLVGTDDSTGYSWDSKIPGDSTKHMFNQLVCNGKVLEDFVIAEIQTVIGPKGLPTKALYQNVLKNDPCTSALSRSQYNFYPSKDGNDADKLKRIYARYWTKFDSNLPNVLSWRLFMEWFNVDYRWGLYIYKRQSDGKPFWHVQGQFLPEKDKTWEIDNHDIEVPIDRWFLLEVFWNQEDSSNGRIWVSIDGNVIADRYGSNKRNRGVDAWCIFKNYGSARSGHWIDDVEIWDDIPDQMSFDRISFDSKSLLPPIGVEVYMN